MSPLPEGGLGPALLLIQTQEQGVRRQVAEVAFLLRLGRGQVPVVQHRSHRHRLLAEGGLGKRLGAENGGGQQWNRKPEGRVHGSSG